MSQVKQVFVINDAALATTLAQVKDGKFGFIKDGTVSTTITVGDKDVQFGRANKTSLTVSTGDLTRVYRATYSAGTAQSSKVDLSAALPDGYSAKYVRILDTSMASKPWNSMTFEGATTTEIVDAINAADDFLADFTASAAVDVITITAPKNTTFRIAAIPGAVISYTGNGTTAMSPSVGTPEQVAEYERKALPWEGIRSVHQFPVIKPVSEVAMDSTYDLVYADFTIACSRKDGQGHVFYEQVSFVFACVATAGTLSTALTTQLAKLA